jgi:hypothetical protein
MGITRERVRQIEKKALNKLKRRLSKEGLTLDNLVGDIKDLPQRKAGGIRHDD